MELKQQSIGGFGYSFSNVVYNPQKENGKPYVAVGAVNITEDDSEDSTAIMLTSSLICIGITNECKSKGILSTKLLEPFRQINGTSPGNISLEAIAGASSYSISANFLASPTPNPDFSSH